jgi:hypothetical protein
MNEIVINALERLYSFWEKIRPTVQTLLKMVAFGRMAGDLFLFFHGVTHAWFAVMHMHLPDDGVWADLLKYLARCVGHIHLGERGFFAAMFAVGVLTACGGLWRLHRRWKTHLETRAARTLVEGQS